MKKKLLLGLIVVIAGSLFMSCKKESLDKPNRQYFYNGMVYVNETYDIKDTYRSFDICCLGCSQDSEVEVMIEHQGQLIVYETVYGTDTVHVEWYHPATMCRLSKVSVSNGEMNVMRLK